MRSPNGVPLSDRKPRTGPALGATLVLCALLLVFLPAAGTAQSVSSAPTGLLRPAVGVSWAWSGERSVSGNGSATSPVLGPYSYLFHGLFGSAEVLNQSSGPNGSLRVTGTGVQGAFYTVTLCAPSCRDPFLTANISAFGYLRQQGTANLTSEGNVQESGGSVPALALLGSGASTRGNVTRLYQWKGSGPYYDRSGFQYYSDAVSSSEAISFSPSLGLVPSAPAAGESWSATAGFASSGQFVSAGHEYSTNGGSRNFRRTGALDHQGNVSLAGSSPGNYSLGTKGRGPMLSLEFSGALGLGAGPCFLFPSTSLFLGPGTPWGDNATTPALTGPARLDWSLNSPHLGAVGAETDYTATNLSAPSLSGRAAPSNPTGPSVGPTSVDSAPAGVSGAFGLMASLLTPPALNAPAYPHPALPLAGVAVAGGVIAVGLLLAAPRWGLPPRVPEAREGYEAFRTLPPDPSASGRADRPSGKAEGGSGTPETDPLSYLL